MAFVLKLGTPDFIFFIYNFFLGAIGAQSVHHLPLIQLCCGDTAPKASSVIRVAPSLSVHTQTTKTPGRGRQSELMEERE